LSLKRLELAGILDGLECQANARRADLAHLDATIHQVLDDDVARLSPLGHEHINMLGRYTFTLPDRVARGELRPLRDPNQPPDEE